MKKVYKIALIITFCICMSGCATYEQEVIEKDADTLSFQTTVPETGSVQMSVSTNGLTSVSETVPIDGEPFSLVCTYDTRDYPLDEWRVTSNKNIYMTVNTCDLPEGYKVYIEHVHADIVLKATSPEIDGITQDSMDDSDHRSPSKGFPISNTTTYTNIFSIEGYTEHFYTLWGHAFGAYGGFNGRVNSKYQRLTESNIRKHGTYAEKLLVVYDLIICTPDFPGGYSKSVYSEVLIPLTDNSSTINLYGSYECIKDLPVKDTDSSEQKILKKGNTWTCSKIDHKNETVELTSYTYTVTIPMDDFKEFFREKE